MRPIMAKAIGYMKPDIDPNLRLYVPFNEGVRSVAKDYSQYGNHVQLTDVEWSPDGFNGAGKFNGSSSFGDCGNDASLNVTDAITIEAWIKIVSINGNHIVHKSDTYHTGTGFMFYIHSNNRLYFDLESGSHVINYDLNPSLNVWYCLVVTYDEGTGNSYLYINGEEKANGSAAGALNNNNNVLIGKRDYALDKFFNGTIDEVRIYALALSAAQNAADCYEVVCS